ncbi:MAG: DEAD/DEAH box helicase [Candidatus Nanopelagicales bacterium]|nr:DEAD/DEAH box helicase [Candidatus Nanopelagicales bacterium]
MTVSEPAVHPGFASATSTWFGSAFTAPTEVQVQAWEAIASGDDTLVVSPTGSGKTLAAFLWALDDLFTHQGTGCRVLYISPLRALAADVERNLRAPLAGIEQVARSLGQTPPQVRTAIRTSDTPTAERARMARTPPDILITTPESLFLLLTSKAGEFLRDVQTVIVDEIHSVAGSKRGSHLSLSLQRLELLTGRRPQRIGLSATVTPVETVAHYLHAGVPVRIVQPDLKKDIDLQLTVPLADMTVFDEPADGQPRRASIWPAVETSILSLIEDHTSTIVFTNSRRVCERLSSRLNELASDQTPEDAVPAQLMAQAGVAGGSEQVVARAHHGSVSKSERSIIEDELKSGRLPAVVATSSLELGIDMGSIDLMVQVGCPPSVASGLQRLGRAGHRLDAVSRGVFYPTHRGDLLATAVAVERMGLGQIEPTRIPRHPLDVLSQQIVAMVAMHDWQVDELYDLLTRAAGYTDLPRGAYDAVLDMLSGKYPSDDFSQLRPRINWDRATDTLTGRRGAQRTAVISGGTIPDRGLFPVFIVGTKDSRVGELDEEMVYESRVGDVISLGASSWRIEDITFDRVLVTPAPGRPGKLPFWHADAQGRAYEMGRAIGQFLRETESGLDQRLAACGLDAYARDNLHSYLTEQKQVTGVLPGDRRVLVERFRDEIGDWRVVVHAPWGARVNSPWALLAGSAIRARLGIDADVMATDDGMVLRLLDTEQDDRWWDEVMDALVPDPDELTRSLSEQITTSALFAAKFRECASRALLLTRNAPGKRTPLWQQRQRSAQLLAVAGRYPSFPMVLEAVRECLDDTYDVPALREVLQGLRSGLIAVDVVETQSPSPMAQTQMFSYVSVFMYEADNPLGQQAAALELDHALLAELLSDADLRSIIPQQAIDEVEADLQWRHPGRIRSADDLADLLRHVGFHTEEELADHDVAPEFVDQLLQTRRAFPVRVAGREVVAAVEDMSRLRDALGVVLPAQVPFAFIEPAADPVGDLVSRYARTHGPFSSQDLAHHLGLGERVAESLLQERKKAGLLKWGRFAAASEHGQWIDPDVLQRIRRRAAALLRGAQEPVATSRLCSFLPRWQGLTAPRAGEAALLSAIGRLAGYVAAATVWEQDLLPSRVVGYETHHIDRLTASGELTWCGAGRLGARDALISMVPAGLEDLLPAPDLEELSPTEQQIWDVIGGGGGWFFRDLTTRLPAVSHDDLEEALWGLVWRSVVTNDSLEPLRRFRPGKSRPLRRRGPQLPMPGRWSAVARPQRPDRGLIWAQTLLDRYGLVDRTVVGNERVPGGFHALFAILRRMDEAGSCQQVYAVDGLGGAQFASSLALEQLRQERSAEPVLLAATDPANPLGVTMPWPDITGSRPQRKAGALVLLAGDGPHFYLDGSGRSLLMWPDATTESANTFVTALRKRRGRLGIKRVNGEEALTSPWVPLLVEAGLRQTPSGLR